jgi:hypothetical protein
MNKLIQVDFGEGKYADVIAESANWILNSIKDLKIESLVVLKVKGGKHKVVIYYRYI